MLGSNSNNEIGARKIVALEQQRLVPKFGECVAEAVAEIQSAMTAALTVLPVGVDGEGGLITVEWHHLDTKIIEELVEISRAIGPNRANITIAVSR